VPVASSDPRTDPAVAAFLRELDHPMAAEVAQLRADILAASPSIHEGIKWNAPSFRTGDWFATFQLRGKPGVRIVLHLGARKRTGPRPVIADPAGLLTWLGDDRAIVSFADAAEVAAQRAALTAIVRAWIAHVT
jgi:hypothetical protein